MLSLTVLKNLIPYAIVASLLIGCTNNVKTVKALSSNSSPKSSLVKQTLLVHLTDSAKLMVHLDSLPKAVFPFNIPEQGISEHDIDLAEFKKMKLFKLLYKPIPRVIGGAEIDNERIDSTFNLCDTNYKANWFMVIKTPKFFVVQVDDNYQGLALLVTIDYHLNVIDAIHCMGNDPSSNEHFHGELTSTIYKNLKIVMHYNYAQQASEEYNYETENEVNEDDIWRIDRTGHFKPIKYRPNE